MIAQRTDDNVVLVRDREGSSERSSRRHGQHLSAVSVRVCGSSPGCRTAGLQCRSRQRAGSGASMALAELCSAGVKLCLSSRTGTGRRRQAAAVVLVRHTKLHRQKLVEGERSGWSGGVRFLIRCLTSAAQYELYLGLVKLPNFRHASAGRREQ